MQPRESRVPKVHELVRKTRVALDKIDSTIEEMDRERAKLAELQKNGAGWTPYFGPEGFVTQNVIREGGVLVPPDDVLSIVVTPAERARALGMAETLIRSLRGAGMRVWIEKGKTRVGIESSAFSMRISEIADRHPGATIRHAPEGWIPTGRLRVTLREGPVADFRIRDDSTKTVESQLDSLVAYVKKAADGAASREAMYEAQRRAYKAELQAIAEKEQRGKDRAFALEIDAALEEDVGREARAWRESQEIHAYASALLVSSPHDERVRAWAEWAMQAADAMDPTQRRLRQIEMGAASAEPTEE